VTESQSEKFEEEEECVVVRFSKVGSLFLFLIVEIEEVYSFQSSLKFSRTN